MGCYSSVEKCDIMGEPPMNSFHTHDDDSISDMSLYTLMTALSKKNDAYLSELGIDPEKERGRAKYLLTGGDDTIFQKRSNIHLKRHVVRPTFFYNVTKDVSVINTWINCNNKTGVILQNSYKHNANVETNKCDFLKIRIVDGNPVVTGAKFVWRKSYNILHILSQYSTIQILQYDAKLTLFDILKSHGRYAQHIGDKLGWSNIFNYMEQKVRNDICTRFQKMHPFYKEALSVIPSVIAQTIIKYVSPYNF
jgi:hypothetical protein